MTDAIQITNKVDKYFESSYASSSNLSVKVSKLNDEIHNSLAEIESWELRRENALLALCKYKKDSVLSKFSSNDALEIALDFRENGFHGTAVKTFLEAMNAKFFAENGKFAEWASDLVCFGLEPFNHCGSFCNNTSLGSSFVVQYRDKITKKQFRIEIPIVDNVYFTERNYNDDLLGKYLFYANVPYSAEDLKSVSRSDIVHTGEAALEGTITTLIDANYNGSELIKAIKTYLTTNLLVYGMRYYSPMTSSGQTYANGKNSFLFGF